MFGDTELRMVEDDEALARACHELAAWPVLAIDTESDSFYHYQERVCLVQISTPERDYIIDPLRLRGLDPLQGLLEDPGVRKILHGADYDIVCMKRDFGIAIRGIFDTMVAAQFLGLPRFGLADLIHRYFGIRPDKRFQRHDWSQRPLLEEHLQYARGDTHWLIALAEVMRFKLQREGLLEAALEECALLERREWSGRSASEADFLRLKGAGGLDGDGLRVLRALWQYREELAARLDRPAFKAIPGETLLHLAQRKPRDLDELAECLRPSGSLFRHHGPRLVAAVKAGLADERPLPEPERPARGSSGPRMAVNEPLMARLKAWRNEIVSRQGIAPVVVASNQLLKEVATAEPANEEELAALESIRTWQVRRHGAELLAMVAEHRRDRGESAAPRRRRRRRRAPQGEPQGE